MNNPTEPTPSETPETDALFNEAFGPEEDWTVNQKLAALRSRTLERQRNAFRDQVAELTRGRDVLRQCFAEASHDAGPSFVAHEQIATLTRELEQLRAALEKIKRALPTGDCARTIADKALSAMSARNEKDTK